MTRLVNAQGGTLAVVEDIRLPDPIGAGGVCVDFEVPAAVALALGSRDADLLLELNDGRRLPAEFLGRRGASEARVSLLVRAPTQPPSA